MSINTLWDRSFGEMVNERILASKKLHRDGIPAEVIGTDDYEESQCIAVEFKIADIYPMKESEELRAMKLKKVFVRLPKFGGWEFKFPVSKGDIVILHFSTKDLNRFLSGNGESVQQNIEEVGEIEDCWAELGFGTRKNNNKPSLEDLIITNGAATLTVTQSGDYSLVTSGTGYYKSSKTTIDNDVEITGNLEVKGNNIVDGSVTSKTSMSSPTYSGYAGGGSMTIDNVIVLNDVTINGKSVNGHNHNNTVPNF